MRHILMAAATAATLMVSIGGAQAFPIAPPDGVVAGPEITLVSGGCGPFRHRGFYGGCRPNGYGPGPGFYGRPYGYGFYGPPRRFRHFGGPFGYRHFY